MAFTCISWVSLVTSVILSASKARSAISVFDDVDKILRTSHGSWVKSNALKRVAGESSFDSRAVHTYCCNGKSPWLHALFLFCFFPKIKWKLLNISDILTLNKVKDSSKEPFKGRAYDAGLQASIRVDFIDRKLLKIFSAPCKKMTAKTKCKMADFLAFQPHKSPKSNKHFLTRESCTRGSQNQANCVVTCEFFDRKAHRKRPSRVYWIMELRRRKKKVSIFQDVTSCKPVWCIYATEAHLTSAEVEDGLELRK